MWHQFFQHVLFGTLLARPDDWGITVKSEGRRKKSFSSPACAHGHWSPITLLLNAYQRLVPREGTQISQGIQLIIHLHLVPRLSIHGTILLLLSCLQGSNPKPALLTEAHQLSILSAEILTHLQKQLFPLILFYLSHCAFLSMKCLTWGVTVLISAAYSFFCNSHLSKWIACFLLLFVLVHFINIHMHARTHTHTHPCVCVCVFACLLLCVYMLIS